MEHIGLLVTADLRRMLGTVLKNDGHLSGVRDNMVIGHDIAGGIDDEAEPECHRLFPGIAGRIVEKAPHELIEKGSVRPEGQGSAVALGVPPC